MSGDAREPAPVVRPQDPLERWRDDSARRDAERTLARVERRLDELAGFERRVMALVEARIVALIDSEREHERALMTDMVAKGMSCVREYCEAVDQNLAELFAEVNNLRGRAERGTVIDTPSPLRRPKVAN